MNIEDVLRQINAMEMAAQAMLLNARVLRSIVMASAGLPQEPSDPAGGSKPAAPPSTPEEPPVDCKCPANYRKAASTAAHPQRTVCRRCNKEHLG